MGRTLDAAALLVNNWYLHDKQNYSAIGRNSTELLIKMGYNAASAKRASKIIRNIYKKADLAEKYMTSSPAKENVLYRQMMQMCDRLDNILGRPTNSKNELLWWRAIRHKNIFIALLYLSRDQVSKFGTTKFLSAIKATSFLFKAGRAHDIKNWSLCVMAVRNTLFIVKSKNVASYIEF